LIRLSSTILWNNKGDKIKLLDESLIKSKFADNLKLNIAINRNKNIVVWDIDSWEKIPFKDNVKASDFSIHPNLPLIAILDKNKFHIYEFIHDSFKHLSSFNLDQESHLICWSGDNQLAIYSHNINILIFDIDILE